MKEKQKMIWMFKWYLVAGTVKSQYWIWFDTEMLNTDDTKILNTDDFEILNIDDKEILMILKY